MYGIKFFRPYKNLRPVEKNAFRNIERFLVFLPQKVLKKYSLSLIGDENTFLQVWQINVILVKSAPKQCFSPKTVLPIENLAKSQKYPFLGKA
jgi:hypothetical protein